MLKEYGHRQPGPWTYSEHHHYPVEGIDMPVLNEEELPLGLRSEGGSIALFRKAEAYLPTPTDFELVTSDSLTPHILEGTEPRRRRLDIEGDTRIQQTLEFTDRVYQNNLVSQKEPNPKTGAIGLKHRFRVETPSLKTDGDETDSRFEGLQFGWDNYFLEQPDLRTKEGVAIAKESIANYVDLLREFQIMPNFSAIQALLSSQLPLYPALIMETYEAAIALPDANIEEETKWLQSSMEAGVYEHDIVWTNEDDFQEGIGKYHHRVPEYVCSRAGDRDAGYAQNAARELGWDYSTIRFRGAMGGNADKLLPVDLNAILYKNEMLFAKTEEILGNHEKAEDWKQRAATRLQEMNETMYDRDRKYWFDFRYHKPIDEQGRRPFTLAPVFQLWAETLTGAQAKEMVSSVYEHFDHGHGLTITDVEEIPHIPTREDLLKANIDPEYHAAVQQQFELGQWDGKAVWSPILHTFNKGLLAYAHSEDKGLSARDKLFFLRRAIYNKEVEIQALTDIYQEEDTLPEKWDGLQGGAIKERFHYKYQRNFGWTCSLMKEDAATLPGDYAYEQELLAQIRAEEDQRTLSRILHEIPDSLPEPTTIYGPYQPYQQAKEYRQAS